MQGITDPTAFVNALQQPKPGQGQPYNTVSRATYSFVRIEMVPRRAFVYGLFAF